MLTALLTALWAVAAIAGFGLALGVDVTRRARLPASFAPPLILAAAALVTYALFGVHLIQPYAGRQASRAVWLIATGAFVWSCWRHRHAAASHDSPLALLRHRDVVVPVVLASLLAAAYVCTRYARDAPINRRFTWTLPPDNLLPELFAMRLSAGIAPGSGPIYLFQRWQSSDRPPLEASVILATIPLRLPGQSPELQYQLLGTICQIGWVLACYTLARTLRLTRSQTIAILLMTAGSGFFLLNSLYVWPKLLAAWLLLTAIALLLHARREGRVTSPLLVPITATLATLSLLAHGGAIFSLVALPILLVGQRRFFTPRDPMLAIAIAAIVLAPWLVYQRVYDPPGTALLLQHLAGVEAPDGRSVTQAMRDEYATLTPRAIVEARVDNLVAQVRWDPQAPDETIADWLRRQQFFHHSATLGVLCLGLVALVVRRTAGFGDGMLRLLLGYTVASILVWVVLFFEGGQAVVHQGSYATTVLLFFCGAAGLARVSPAPRAVLIAVHILLFAWMWLVARQTSMSAEPLSWRPATAAVAALFFVSYALALRTLVRDQAGIETGLTTK